DFLGRLSRGGKSKNVPLSRIEFHWGSREQHFLLVEKPAHGTTKNLAQHGRLPRDEQALFRGPALECGGSAVKAQHGVGRRIARAESNDQPRLDAVLPRFLQEHLVTRILVELPALPKGIAWLGRQLNTRIEL